jgi:hypothetical protein
VVRDLTAPASPLNALAAAIEVLRADGRFAVVTRERLMMLIWEPGLAGTAMQTLFTVFTDEEVRDLASEPPA